MHSQRVNFLPVDSPAFGWNGGNEIRQGNSKEKYRYIDIFHRYDQRKGHTVLNDSLISFQLTMVLPTTNRPLTVVNAELLA